MSDWNGFKLIKGAVENTAADLNIMMRDGPDDPILPPTRDRLVEIPGRNGAYDFGADLGPRRISIPCAFLYAGTVAVLNTHAKALAAFLLDNGKPAALELIFESDKTIYYDVRYSGSLDLTRIVFDGLFDLNLIAVDPYAKDVE